MDQSVPLLLISNCSYKHKEVQTDRPKNVQGDYLWRIESVGNFYFLSSVFLIFKQHIFLEIRQNSCPK